MELRSLRDRKLPHSHLASISGYWARLQVQEAPVSTIPALSRGVLKGPKSTSWSPENCSC